MVTRSKPGQKMQPSKGRSSLKGRSWRVSHHGQESRCPKTGRIHLRRLCCQSHLTLARRGRTIHFLKPCPARRSSTHIVLGLTGLPRSARSAASARTVSTGCRSPAAVATTSPRLPR
jgi:hypothetical protein